MIHEPPVLKGLVFFTARHTAAHRRRRLVFVAILAAALLSTIWPVYARFSGLHPFVLGLPLSFAWIVGWLLVVFASLLWLYRADCP